MGHVGVKAPSVATLIYLSADEVVSADKAFTQGVKVPCKEATRSEARAGSNDACCDFLEAVEGGAIHLQVTQQKKLLRTVEKVVAKRTAGDVPGGFDRTMASHVASDRLTVVGDAIESWFAGKYSDPDAEVVGGSKKK